MTNLALMAETLFETMFTLTPFSTKYSIYAMISSIDMEGMMILLHIQKPRKLRNNRS